MPSTVYPTGTTIYQPEKCWIGYSVYQLMDAGPILIDMNGNVANQWMGLMGFPTANKILPGGYVMGSTGTRDPKFGYQDGLDLVQVDWEGNIVWRFFRYDLVRDGDSKGRWMARQHHDYQREGNPVGYYAPGMEPRTDGGNTIIAVHKTLKNAAISEKDLIDDGIIEVDWQGKIVWSWLANEHFEELDFSEEARNTLARNPNMLVNQGVGDWFHMNSVSKVGPNRWFDEGDNRFYPENLIISSRETNVLAIIDKSSGKLVWKVGPDYQASKALRDLGQIIGPHNVHIIPRGLPGEGNVLVYDNGGWAGYGAPNPGAPTGRRNALRDHSRVVEFNPITLEVVWEYPPTGERAAARRHVVDFYSRLMSNSQRLPNGNTFITEGGPGRLFEVTLEYEIVWEYRCPYPGKRNGLTNIYRAYRVPYEWIPQLERPEEKELPRVDNSRFRVPGSKDPVVGKITQVRAKKATVYENQLCVLPELPPEGSEYDI